MRLYDACGDIHHVLFLFYCDADHLDLHVLTHSFPTRRSSDLRLLFLRIEHMQDGADQQRVAGLLPMAPAFERAFVVDQDVGDVLDVADLVRSEEHTSELQSLMRITYAAFCLKKKNTSSTTNRTKYIVTLLHTNCSLQQH